MQKDTYAHAHEHDASEGDVLKDPVCGMTVTPASSHHVKYDGQTFYFCNSKCRAKFQAEPELYLHATATASSIPRRWRWHATAASRPKHQAWPARA